MFTMDIETTAHYTSDDQKNQIIHSKRDKRLTDPDKIQKNIEKIEADAALNPLTGMITVIGIMTPHNATMLVNNVAIENNPLESYDIIDYPDEAQLLQKAWMMLNESLIDYGRLVTFNGKAFDLPYMFTRSIINQVVPPMGIDYNQLSRKYWTDPHLDMSEQLSGSMDNIMKTIGHDEKVVEGKLLPKLWETDPAKVVEKCHDDLKRNMLLYKRISPWFKERLTLSPDSGKGASSDLPFLIEGETRAPGD